MKRKSTAPLRAGDVSIKADAGAEDDLAGRKIFLLQFTPRFRLKLLNPFKDRFGRQGSLFERSFEGEGRRCASLFCVFSVVVQYFTAYTDTFVANINSRTIAGRGNELCDHVLRFMTEGAAQWF